MSGVREKSSINNSVSKQQFAFSKDDRFKKPKQFTNAFGYEIKSQFEKKGGAIGRGFGSSVDRWGFEEKMKQRRGVGKIDGPDSKGVDQVKNRTFSYSFGVSRVQMKKIHVDEILKKTEENLPGPDRYAKDNLFGGKQGSLEGSNY